ncbi:MAG: histidine phosphatase family protein [Betaproteobacteria bacterium]|nr:histidine phosphatase family protein [Betaproteobacteria bacterium]
MKKQQMDLLLWRHAEAEDDYPDASRHLTSRGQQQAKRMADWLRSRAPENLRIAVSPTERTLETVAPFCRDYEVMHEIGTDTSEERLLSAIGWPDAGGAVLIVGHQPTLGNIAADLLDADAPLMIKKGALWWFSHRSYEDGTTETVLKAVIPPSLT